MNLSSRVLFTFIFLMYLVTYLCVSLSFLFFVYNSSKTNKLRLVQHRLSSLVWYLVFTLGMTVDIEYFSY